MKIITLCKCDYCDFTHEDPDVVEIHEAGHLNLNKVEYAEYRSLRSFTYYLKGEIKRLSIMEDISNIDQIGLMSKRTEKLLQIQSLYDQKLAEFEQFKKDHNIPENLN